MTSEVPPDFDRPWALSDIVLRTNNAGGKDIYACKTALAMFSPYFGALFFGNFKEKDASSLNVDCDYDVMLEIVRDVHQIGYDYSGRQQPAKYTSEMLVKLYRAADLYDFAFIRKMCIQQVEGFASAAMANVASELELYDIRTEILKRLTEEELYDFLRNGEPKYRLSKEEFLLIFEKIAGEPFPNWGLPPEEKEPMEPLNLENLAREMKNPRVDLTKPWPTADLAIVTNNSKGRVLYANKAMIDVLAPNFNKYLEKIDKFTLETNMKFVARVDEDYTTIKEILSVVQMCKVDFSEFDGLLHPAILHSMYCAADVDRLNIPMIRSLCISKLVAWDCDAALDVLWHLNLHDSMDKLLSSFSAAHMQDWIWRDDKHLSYWNGRKVIEVTRSPKDPVISKDFTLPMIEELKDFLREEEWLKSLYSRQRYAKLQYVVENDEDESEDHVENDDNENEDEDYYE